MTSDTLFQVLFRIVSLKKSSAAIRPCKYSYVSGVKKRVRTNTGAGMIGKRAPPFGMFKRHELLGGTTPFRKEKAKTRRCFAWETLMRDVPMLKKAMAKGWREELGNQSVLGRRRTHGPLRRVKSNLICKMIFVLTVILLHGVFEVLHRTNQHLARCCGEWLLSQG